MPAFIRAQLSQLPKRLPSGLAVWQRRSFAVAAASPDLQADLPIDKIRNIGISAHIDSGKTTLTERVLFYTGRIGKIHEVKGRDQKGATMDFMELEREKGITIQSAATYCAWGDHRINIIDTPGHVDFTIEVERSLRVLDGAVMLMCGVAGVQSQTLTVDRQMKRYAVPRIAFVNKLDRMGANPWKALAGVRERLRLNAAALQVPIGLEGDFQGVCDVVTNRAVFFDGANGEHVRYEEVPAELRQAVAERRRELVEILANVDPELEELFLADREPTPADLHAAIRRATVAQKFVPLMMGSAYKNKGVQLVLDGVCSYLPNPSEKRNIALDRARAEAEVELDLRDARKPFVGLAFKLDEGAFGQLTFIRVYQGRIKKGTTLLNTSTNKRVKVPRLVRMHANTMEDISEAGAGEIFAMFGVDCSTGDTFTDGSVSLAMTSMFVPEPVMSLSIAPTKSEYNTNFAKALSRFTKEDPTFRLSTDPVSNERIMSGMGELHLQIYTERMRREYNVEVKTGPPKVNYRETLSRRAEFNYLHKKQSGGAGQYGKVAGYIEPLPEGSKETFEFENALIGNAIPPEFVAACEKGFREACEKGQLTGNPVVGVRVVLQDGAAHVVDSNELAFRLAAIGGFRQAFEGARPQLLEPIMTVEVQCPVDAQGTVIANLNRRRGVVQNTETQDDLVTITAEVPLSQMFGYSTDLRSSTQGQAEFAMEYARHQPVPPNEQTNLTEEYQKKRLEDLKSK